MCYIKIKQTLKLSYELVNFRVFCIYGFKNLYADRYP